MVTLKEGDKAPAFAGKDQNGKKISLPDYKGKKLVLYFYPEADTPPAPLNRAISVITILCLKEMDLR